VSDKSSRSILATTARIGPGTAIFVWRYHPPLATAKRVATIRELSGDRPLLDVDPRIGAKGGPRDPRSERLLRLREQRRRDAAGFSSTVGSAADPRRVAHRAVACFRGPHPVQPATP
jgi:alkanesulfonate monooxygenase SsuD/methylene tetrahydromethanopterin reductase-like flavin-dependent oxidoreductase (luciferase family)